MPHNVQLTRSVRNALIVFVLSAVALVALFAYSVRQVESTHHRLITEHSDTLIEVERLALANERKVANTRAYMLTLQPMYFERMVDARTQFEEHLRGLGTSLDSEEGKALVERIAVAEEQHHREIEALISALQSGAPLPEATSRWLERVQPLRDRVRTELTALTRHKESLLAEAKVSSEAAARRVLWLVVGATLTGLALSGFFLLALLRSVRKAYSEQQKSAEELRDRERRLMGLVDSAMDGIITVDQDQRIILFNRAAEQIFRCPATEAIGSPLDRFIPSRYRHAHRDHIKDFGRTGTTSRTMHTPGNVYGLRKTGEEFPLEATISQMEFKGEKLFTVILRDVTERELSHRALQASEKLASTGRMAGTIAHEINNPLEAISGLAFLLQNETDLNSDIAREQLRLLSEEVARLTHVAQRTLGLYRETQHPVPVKLHEIIDSVIDLYSRRLASRRITVDRDYGTHQPIEAYPGEMRQVFSNLIINAVDAMQPGGLLRVSLEDTIRDGVPGVLTRVIDTGSGIPNENLPHIFEPFYSTKGDRGTGIGLWVSRGFVVKHGGEISVSSRTGADHGTQFNVFLPLRQPVTEVQQKFG